MSILFQCPTCSKQLRAALDRAKKKGACPSCKEKFVIPVATSAQAASRAPALPPSRNRTAPLPLLRKEPPRHAPARKLVRTEAPRGIPAGLAASLSPVSAGHPARPSHRKWFVLGAASGLAAGLALGIFCARQWPRAPQETQAGVLEEFLAKLDKRTASTGLRTVAHQTEAAPPKAPVAATEAGAPAAVRALERKVPAAQSQAKPVPAMPAPHENPQPAVKAKAPRPEEAPAHLSATAPAHEAPPAPNGSATGSTPEPVAAALPHLDHPLPVEGALKTVEPPVVSAAPEQAPLALAAAAPPVVMTLDAQAAAATPAQAPALSRRVEEPQVVAKPAQVPKALAKREELPAHFSTAREVQECVKNRYQGDDAKMRLSLVLSNSRGEKRVTQLVRYRKKENGLYRTLLSYVYPTDIKGTATLTIEQSGADDLQRMYLPALKKLRRISSPDKGKSWAGTDFSYEDLQEQKLDDFEYSALNSELRDGHACFHYSVTPKAPGNSSYGKIESWVRKDILQPHQSLYYDKKGKCFKELNFKDYRKIEDARKVREIWTPLHLEAVHYEDKHSSDFIIEKVVYNTGIDDSMFTPRTMENVPENFDGGEAHPSLAEAKNTRPGGTEKKAGP